MISEKKMKKSGLEKVNIAKENGMWFKKTIVNQIFSMPDELSKLLKKNKLAKDNFEKLPPSHKKNFINWIASAKKTETKIRRSEKALEMLLNNQRMGI